ncbi:ribosomal protein S19e-domain-containing protein, partial [Phellopilus nigrolimitatus]
MPGVQDVSADVFISAHAAHLKCSGKLEVLRHGRTSSRPDTSRSLLPMTLTGTTRAPVRSSQLSYIRIRLNFSFAVFISASVSLTAAVACHIYLRKSIDISALSKLHGGRNRRGNRPSHHADASASVQCKVCLSLEKIGVLELSDNGGRHISQDGQRDLDHIATAVVERRARQRRTR